MDAGGLDLRSGKVLLHKLLALQSVPQSALPRVSVSSDDDFHWKAADCGSVRTQSPAGPTRRPLTVILNPFGEAPLQTLVHGLQAGWDVLVPELPGFRSHQLLQR